MNEAIDEILDNVRRVPLLGHPGTLTVFDPNAYPILTGNDKSSIIFAAAEVGLGRVFVASHELYVYNFIHHKADDKAYAELKQLWTNVRRWLTRDQSSGAAGKEPEFIHGVEEYDSVLDIPEDVKLLKWIGTHNKTEIFINQLLKKYLTNGGSLICGVCPWGWLSISHGKSIEEMGLNKFLSSCGICFTNEFYPFESGYVDVDQNLAHSAHLGNAINLLANHMSAAIGFQGMIVKGINSLPCQIASKRLDKIHKILYSYICSKYMPTSKTSVTCPIGISLLSICSNVYQKYSACGLRVKAPNIEEFPGTFLPDILDGTSTVNYKPEDLSQTGIVTIKSKFDEFHCTGYYLPPGQIARATVLEGNHTGWEIRIGAHTDDLSDMSFLNRWPSIHSVVKLSKSMSLTSAFGGIIYCCSPKGTSMIKLRLENVVETPYFDLNQEDTVSDWKRRRSVPGLWAEISGKHIAFTVPSWSIRELDNPAEALRLWDQIVVSHHDLRGTDARNTWRERVVVDVQPHGGIMHAGYPVVITYDFVKPDSSLYLFNKENIMSGAHWSIIHELAHNMQRMCWTPSGGLEITVNIFTLHAFDCVLQKKPWINKFLQDKLDEKPLEKHNFTYKEWCMNPYVGLLLYAQLINSFGWEAFKQIFREYESLNEKEKLFTSDLDKWNTWLCRFSNIVELDISPLFYFWSIPFSENSGTNLDDLNPWLPDDEITRRFPKRIEHVKEKYKGLVLGNESVYTTINKMIYSSDSNKATARPAITSES